MPKGEKTKFTGLSMYENTSEKPMHPAKYDADFSADFSMDTSADYSGKYTMMTDRTDGDPDT